jgi:hypothetical protein
LSKSARGVRLRRPAACVAGVLAAAAASAACQAGVARPALAPVLSNYERATAHAVGRDCGYSSPVPGQPGRSLWLFCDTEVAARDGKVDRLILGTDTAAAGPYQAGRPPIRLTELPTPPAPPAGPAAAAPQPFLPAPQGLLLPAGTLPCAGPRTYPASWISGVTRVPGSASLLLSYDDYCVTGNDDAQTAEGFGLVEYDPAANLLGPPAHVFGPPAVAFGGAVSLPLPPQQVLGSPVIGGDGYLYLFGFRGPAALAAGAGRVFLARTLAQPASWPNPFTYQYWTGSGWSPDPNAAGDLIPASEPLAVSVGDYAAVGHGLVMIEQTSLAGRFRVWQSTSPAGPWRPILAGQVPCRRGTQRGSGGLCRAIIGHPELSTRRRLLISYFDPASNHLEVSAYAW